MSLRFPHVEQDPSILVSRGWSETAESVCGALVSVLHGEVEGLSAIAYCSGFLPQLDQPPHQISQSHIGNVHTIAILTSAYGDCKLESKLSAILS